MGPFEIVCSALIGYLLYVIFAPMNFWKKRGVKGPKPIPLLGNFKDVMFVKEPVNKFIDRVYNDYPDEALVGIYARKTPILVVKDLDLIKDVLIKDFSHFMDRGLKIHDKVEPLSQHLFSLEPKRWRPLRVKLSPVFTSGKLKEMFYIIQECCDGLHDYMETLIDQGEPIEIREVFAKFTTDIIGSCAFGLKMNAMTDEKSEFRKMGRKIFATNWFKIFSLRVRDSMPKVYELLKPVFEDKETTEFFMGSIKQTMEYRDKENIRRHDFVDILRDLKKDPAKVGDDIELTDSLITSQAFVFFIAGFETSSATMGHMMYEIAQHQDIQDKMRNEIFDELKKNNGKLNYENFKNMKYMHQVFEETLRMYPVVTVLFRESVQPYTFSGTNISIPTKTKVWIPIYSIQRDPMFFPNPEVFDPENFSEELKQTRHPMTHLPFGDGPRNCIGERFAVYQVKAGIAKLLQHYRVDVCEKTRIPYVQHPASFVMSPIDGIHLKLTRLIRMNE